MKAFFFVSDLYAAGYYRGLIPSKALSIRGHNAFYDIEFKIEYLKDLDVLVFQRKAKKFDIGILKNAKSLGILTVYDLEDNLWRADYSNPGKWFWTHERLEDAEYLIRNVDLVVVTTKKLKEFIQKFNRNVEIIPNYLDLKMWNVDKEEKDTVIGWSGSPSHVRDLKFIEPILLQIKEEYPSVRILIHGVKRKEADLSSLIEVDEEWVGFRDYPNKMARYTIGVCPLIDSQFNQAKSDLKFVEFAALKTPTVCSAIGEYVETVSHKENGFLARKPIEWLKYLRLLIENKDLRVEIGEKAYEVAKRRDLDACGKHWENVLSENLIRKRGMIV